MPPTNLARPPEPLVGRAGDRAAIAARFAEGGRVVTITGPGGVGKSRLAVEVGLDALASEGAGDPGGVWRVEFAEARSLAALCDAVALALGVPGEPAGGEDPALRVGRALAARGEALLILDDADALLDPAAAAVGRWLALAPEASFLVTSRERLRIAGESVHELGPLGLPEPGAIAGSEAVELFVRAAHRVRRDYVLTDAEAPFVAAVVRELDGLPLAIELGAPRMAVMGARALLHRMKSRFEVLRRGDRGGPDRHATLEAAIDASWSALAAEEQAALAQLTVFHGGLPLEAAEAVVDLRAHPGAPPVLELMQALRDKSLLIAAPSRAMPGEIRLGMYRSVRAFAASKLDAEATRAVEARHAAWVVGAAEGWAGQLGGREGPAMRARILGERDNLLAVIERVLGRGPVTVRTAEPALRALLLLAPALLHEGPLEAYVRLLDPVLSATRDSGADPRLGANALAVRGALLRQRGQGRAAARDLVQALAIARTVGDARLEARVTHELGHALAGRGETDAAREHFERAMALHQGAGDRSEVGDTLGSLGSLLARRGRLDEAALLFERALVIHRAEQSPVAEAGDLRLLGALEIDAGRLAEARAHLTAGRDRARAIGDRRGEAEATGLLALADHLAEDPAAARAGYEAAAAALGELGFLPLEALENGRLGILCREEGRTAEAFLLLAAAEGALADDAGAAGAAILLAHRAALDAAVGRLADARTALDRAAARLDRAGDPAARAILALAQACLDPALAAPSLAAARALADRSADVRLALRAFDRRVPGRASEPPPPPDDALLVGPGGQWFRAPGGARVPLDRRRPLALLLDRLASERLDRPGAPLGWDALLLAAWPGERVQAAAGAHRVRVAVSTLRKLGLKEILRTAGEGYVLTPEILAVRAA